MSSFTEENAFDVRVLARVDDVCAALHTTRAYVLRCLVFALVDEVPEVKPWTEPDFIVAGRIVRKLQRVGHARVRDLRCATRHDDVSPENWERVLDALCRAGKVRVDQEPTRSGQTTRVAYLPTDRAKLDMGLIVRAENLDSHSQRHVQN